MTNPNICKVPPKEECKHKRKYGRDTIDFKGIEFIERVCIDCGYIVDLVRNEYSGVMF